MISLRKESLQKEIKKNTMGNFLKVESFGHHLPEGYENYTGIAIDSDGDLGYFLDGKLHRENDLPAVDGKEVKMWFRNGQRHREGDFPAFIHVDGTKGWYWKNKLHRLDGPARILKKLDSFDFSKELESYWIFGMRLTKEQFENLTQPFVNVHSNNLVKEKIQYKEVKRFGELPSNFTGVVRFPFSTRLFLVQGIPVAINEYSVEGLEYEGSRFPLRNSKELENGK